MMIFGLILNFANNLARGVPKTLPMNTTDHGSLFLIKCSPFFSEYIFLRLDIKK